MNWPELEPEFAADLEAEPTAATSINTALFINDTGELPLETRRVLVQLLSGPAIDGQLHSKLWPILRRDETIIRSRLSELFLTLVIDKDLQVAFTQQADTGELETPRLLRRAQLTFLDSVLLLYLRYYLIQAETRGERAVITTDEIIEYLKPYARRSSTDHAGFIKNVRASLEKIKKQHILRKLRATEDRFEISPTLKILFSAEEIQTLTKLYQQLLTEGTLLNSDPISLSADEAIA